MILIMTGNSEKQESFRLMTCVIDPGSVPEYFWKNMIDGRS
jgi:hypothetical protein